MKIARGFRPANHAQFINDTIFLVGMSTVIVERFKRVVSAFLRASDCKIDASKSKDYGWNCPHRTMARISRILGFKGLTIWNSFSYLGIPILKGGKKMVDWHSVIDKEKKNQFLRN